MALCRARKGSRRSARRVLTRSAQLLSFPLHAVPAAFVPVPISHSKLRRTTLRGPSFLKRHPRVVVGGGLGSRRSDPRRFGRRLRRVGIERCFAFPRLVLRLSPGAAASTNGRRFESFRSFLRLFRGIKGLALRRVRISDRLTRGLDGDRHAEVSLRVKPVVRRRGVDQMAFTRRLPFLAGG